MVGFDANWRELTQILKMTDPADAKQENYKRCAKNVNKPSPLDFRV